MSRNTAILNRIYTFSCFLCAKQSQDSYLKRDTVRHCVHLWHYLLFIFVISSISKSKEATFLRSWRLTHVYWPALAVVDRDTADWSKSAAAAEATSETTKHKTSWNWCKCKRERETQCRLHNRMLYSGARTVYFFAFPPLHVHSSTATFTCEQTQLMYFHKCVQVLSTRIKNIANYRYF